MEPKTSSAELRLLINRLLDRMDEKALRSVYAHANRVFCAGYPNQPLQRTSQPRKRKTGGNSHANGKGPITRK